MFDEDINMVKINSSTMKGDDSMSEEVTDNLQDNNNIEKEDEPIYSRDEVVKEVSELYELLVGLHIRGVSFVPS